MNQTTSPADVPSSIPTTPPARTPLGARVLWVLGFVTVIALMTIGWRVWDYYQSNRSAVAVDPMSPETLDSRLLEVEQLLRTMRRNQQTQEQKLSDIGARQSVVRDEVLAVSQRSALLEEGIDALSENRRDGERALRVDEIELLLSFAKARLELAHDRAGALRAYALADQLLDSLTEPQFVNVRQTLAQEVAMLNAMAADPKLTLAGELDALEASLPELEAAPALTDDSRNSPDGWQRLLNALVQVRDKGERDLIAPADRDRARMALALDISLARLALERRDQGALQGALQRIDGWLRRLFVDSPSLRERRSRLTELSSKALSQELPTLGTTLKQLRQIERTSSAAQ